MTDRNQHSDGQHSDGQHSDGAETVTATEAKQGRWGRPVLWILIIGTGGAILALLGIMGIFQA
ncbi:MAG: hypothetical protein WD711_05220 [Dongiaceae bacterium]